MSRLRKPKRTQILVFIGLMIGMMVVCGIGLTLMGPTVGRMVMEHPLTQECSYRLTVVTYVDRNGNGVRDENEPGLAGVGVSVEVGPQLRAKEVTDSTGLVQIERYAYVCERGLEDHIVVNLDPPSGYTLSPAQFGPFPVTAYPREPPMQVIYAGFEEQ